MSCHIKHNSNAWNTWEKASSLMNYIAALLSPSKKKPIGRHTHTHLCIHLFQLRLLQRRMMHDAWSMFHSSTAHYCGKSSKLCTRNEPRNPDSKGCWHFYVMSQNVKKMYFKTLNPMPFNLRKWFEVRFFSVVICKCCKFSTSLLGLCTWEFFELKKKQIQGICLITINNLTLCVHLFLRQLFGKLNKKRI